MSERYLQSLAILLAGLFCAERFRSNRLSAGTLAPASGQEPTNDAAARAQANEPKVNQH
jgi:hypothetical protein